MKRLLATIATLFCLLAPVSASAYNPLTQACNSGSKASSSTGCSIDATHDPISGSHGVLRRVSLIIAVVAGIAAVIIIIVAGFEFITSAGDAKKAANARTAIISASVGLIIIIAAESILTFVVSKI